MYKVPEAVRMLISLLILLTVILQTFALIFSFYRFRKDRWHGIEALWELVILAQVIVLSTLHGQILHGYLFGLFFLVRGALHVVVPLCVVLLAMITERHSREGWPLAVLFFACLTLPTVETVSGAAFLWLYIAALLFWLIRSAYLSVLRYRTISEGISSLSVKNAVDELYSGILISAADGHIVLVNRQMQKLMLAITGKVQRNFHEFYEVLNRGELQTGCQRSEYQGQIICRLPDTTSWMFSRTEMPLKAKRYAQLTASDISENWSLTMQLREQEEELVSSGAKLAETIANVQVLSREKELTNARIHAHDTLGRNLTLLVRSIQSRQTPDYELILAQTRNLATDLKRNQGSHSAKDRFSNMQQVYRSIGVEVHLAGSLPEETENGAILAAAIDEGTANAVRHGFATEVFIRIERESDGWSMQLLDNGRPPTEPIVESGIGVMRARIEPLGGKLRVITKPYFILDIFLPEETTYV